MAGNIIPNIVKNGLIHYSDVPNSKFYSGGTEVRSLLTGGTGTLEFSSGVTGGVLDKAFLLDGIDDKVILNNSYTRSVSTFPIFLDMWVNVDPECTNLNTIFSSSEDSFYRGISLQVNDVTSSGFSFVFSYFDGVGGIGFNNRRSFIVLPPTKFEFNKWYHVSSGITDYDNCDFYCNGILYSVITDGGYTGSNIQISNNYPACIGKSNGYPYYFKGKVSNIKVYDTYLTSEEVNKNFNAHKKRYNL